MDRIFTTNASRDMSAFMPPEHFQQRVQSLISLERKTLHLRNKLLFS